MIVGLTGGIGSGKTTVARIFARLGVPVFEADQESKKLLDSDDDLKKALIALLGSSLYKNNRLDRDFMASKIFGDKALLQKVNQLIHPAVGQAFKRWHKKQQAPYVMREAAILFESGSYKDCDHIIMVSAPLDMRIERVMKRSGLSHAQVMERVNQQWPEEQKQQLSDSIIYNDHRESVIKQVLRIHENLIRQANPGS